MSVEATQLAESLHEVVTNIKHIEQRTRVRRYPAAHLFCIEIHYSIKLVYLKETRRSPKPDPFISSNLRFDISQQ